MQVQPRGDDLLVRTRRFWDANPCDGHETFRDRAAFRYRKEPWIAVLLDRVASQHDSVVEIGCGQGTDALTLCRQMRTGGSYLGVDYSPESVRSARDSATDVAASLRIVPEFRVGNAEALDFPDSSLSCIYSCGVLHHSPSTEKCVHEIFRVLQPGGRAYVILYRRWSPKVLAAHILRYIQSVVDRATRRERTLYAFLKNHNWVESVCGTAVLECFGVPVLRSFTRSGMQRLFARFVIENLVSLGDNSFGLLRPLARADRQLNSRILGVHYLIVVTKPRAA
jgi:SAM-dependent methyltransferase